ncbi:cuticle collagen 2-like isoform X2 [Aquila chrysaetos chrysaetos]|uniref:cuticle collagen 2-like isoform X2 n=1 Tax=Aquila chrysaetos chrysaetos TaxID=223781 RepID=UPI001176911C|nr:cuticle collagen 2-like isoform X2 [Aquila chrysaetos chrysaetos]
MAATPSPVPFGPDGGTGQRPARGGQPRRGAPAAAPAPAAGLGCRSGPVRAFPVGRCLRTSPGPGAGGGGGSALCPREGRPPRPARPPRRGPRLALTSELVSSDPRWTLTPGSRVAGRAMHVGQLQVCNICLSR